MLKYGVSLDKFEADISMFANLSDYFAKSILSDEGKELNPWIKYGDLIEQNPWIKKMKVEKLSSCCLSKGEK